MNRASCRGCSRGSVAATGLMARSVKGLLHRPEDLSSDLQKPHGKARHRSAPVFLALGGRDEDELAKLPVQ